MENLKVQDADGQTAPIDEKNNDDINWKQFLRDLVETLLLAIVLYVGINALSARVRVDGMSMQPTLENGEFILINRIPYKFWDIERGDIIVFHHPVDQTQELIKRVIGLPGDIIIIKDKQVLLNGIALQEQYIAASPVYDGQWLVPNRSVFVLGDNRNDSSDSHSWGMLPMENIVGKAVLIYWPPPQWAVIHHIELLSVD